MPSIWMYNWLLKSSLTYVAVVSAGGSWNLMLYWSLCVHHIWRLRSLLWRRVHSDPCCHYNSSGDASLHHRSDWMLRHNPWKLLWSGNSEWALLVHHQHNAVVGKVHFSLSAEQLCYFVQFAAILLLVFVTECVVVVLGYTYRAKVSAWIFVRYC